MLLIFTFVLEIKQNKKHVSCNFLWIFFWFVFSFPALSGSHPSSFKVKFLWNECKLFLFLHFWQEKNLSFGKKQELIVCKSNNLMVKFHLDFSGYFSTFWSFCVYLLYQINIYWKFDQMVKSTLRYITSRKLC